LLDREMNHQLEFCPPVTEDGGIWQLGSLTIKPEAKSGCGFVMEVADIQTRLQL
jgi:hypothetical protein